MIFTPEITLTNDVCDSINVPRGTQITLSRDVLEQNMLISIPDDLCDFIKVSHGTKMTRAEIERIGKKFVRDNLDFIEASWNHLIFNKDLTITDSQEVELYNLFRLRALIKPETYPLPDELCNLLEIPAGTPMNRFDLENQVNEYIRVHKLRIKNNMVNLCEDGGNLRKVFLFWNNNNAINHYDMVMSVMAYFVEKIQLANTLESDFKKVAFTISDELADFLKLDHGSKISLADAVRRVAKYTYENDLQIWDSKKNSFTLDANLRALFSLSEGDALELTYEALEKNVKKHIGVKKYDLNTPLEIPDELCDFFEVAHGTQMSEIDVVRNLNVYIREKKLRSWGDRRAFIPDQKMRTLFAIPEEIIEINYYEIRKYIGVYFAGKVAYPASNQDPSKSVPIAVSDELCDFFQISHGTKMSKIDAILGIAKYTWDHTLLFGKNDYFTADDKLVDLFSLEIGDEDHAEERKITYDRIEKLLSKHFIGSA